MRSAREAFIMRRTTWKPFFLEPGALSAAVKVWRSLLPEYPRLTPWAMESFPGSASKMLESAGPG